MEECSKVVHDTDVASIHVDGAQGRKPGFDSPKHLRVWCSTIGDCGDAWNGSNGYGCPRARSFPLCQ